MNLLLGGLITLAVTALVQIMIIPWVQQRNRRMERWEDDLNELTNILREEIPPAYFKATVAVSQFYTLRREDPSDQHEDALARTSAAFDRDRDELWRHVVRANLLKRRIRLVRRDSPYWPELCDAISKVSRTVAKTTFREYTQDRSEIYDVLLRNEQDHGEAMKQARDLIDLIAIPMRPPPGRVARWAERHLPLARRSRSEDRKPVSS
ncbi:hypothetical protein [Actinoplanes sp. NPDC026619]|uniref:hypothetical protein n=1 Tax=Actinoplanes sp. NPDC026619 TaxID=3155798 RepID=UPI0033C61CBD